MGDEHLSRHDRQPTTSHSTGQLSSSKFVSFHGSNHRSFNRMLSSDDDADTNYCHWQHSDRWQSHKRKVHHRQWSTNNQSGANNRSFPRPYPSKSFHISCLGTRHPQYHCPGCRTGLGRNLRSSLSTWRRVEVQKVLTTMIHRSTHMEALVI